MLLKQGVHPIVQDDFPPDYRNVSAMLQNIIASCDAVVCLVGFYYGAEPKNRPDDQPRRSYTQLEYDIALALHKPVYMFVVTDDCQDELSKPPTWLIRASDPEELQLQLAHRDRLPALKILQTTCTRAAPCATLGE